MIELSVAEIARIVSGRIVSGDAETRISGLTTTDSREVRPGSVFVAKPGEVTDGFLFIPEAVRSGAALIIAERETDVDVPLIVVDDTVAALGDLAREVIARVRALGTLRVVGITGSNGKTTTKNLLRAILSAEGPTVAPRGSFNNEVGAPVTFLEVTEQTHYLVAEMGASHVGDIDRLTRMAPPDIGVVLKVGLAHAREFGGIERTFRAKSEMVTSLGADGVAVLNRDDDRVAQMAELTSARVLWFGLDPSAHVRATDIRSDIEGTRFTLHIGEQEAQVRFRVIGEHHVSNALAAAAVASEWGVPIERIVTALESVELAERGRMQPLRGRGITVIHDAYNASPDSMAAALKTLASVKPEGGRTFAVLGAMSELGDETGAAHDDIGIRAVRLRIDQVVAVGADARRIHVSAVNEGAWNDESVHIVDHDEAFEWLIARLQPGDVVLVKASNSAGLHRLAERLGEWLS
ncbi:MAG TPA: UDP-N-acetylmuramoyl-tripeptide--D-alanyl-D-alanine ligase [Microbacteriaceae bacterium]|nr:UDP-N-acetylmuramoyl-tripeptide--D-alanyl-D-alanine ligase [Microbacteriaceae bacterium]